MILYVSSIQFTSTWAHTNEQAYNERKGKLSIQETFCNITVEQLTQLHKSDDLLIQRIEPYIRLISSDEIEQHSLKPIGPYTPTQFYGGNRRSYLAALISLLLLKPVDDKPPSEMAVERRSGHAIEAMFDSEVDNNYTYSA